jgi:hypothetical protein
MHKEFSVDWDSLDEVSRAFNRTKSRFFELKRIADGQPSKKERERRVFDACQAIWHADISQVYSGLILDQAPVYYVYAHLDTAHRVAVGRAGITSFAATIGLSFWPFYIGKGVGDRWCDLNRNETHRKTRQRIEHLGFEPKPVLLAKGLTESEALQREAKLIDIFGLIMAGGLLTNLDEGAMPEERRSIYRADYHQLRRLNQVTHVNGAESTGKTRVVPATSTKHSVESALRG